MLKQAKALEKELRKRGSYDYRDLEIADLLEELVKLVEVQGEYIELLTDDLKAYDPTWFIDDPGDIGYKLRAKIKELEGEGWTK